MMSSTNRMKKTGPSTEPRGNPSSDAERKAAGTTNLDFSSTVRKQGAYPKNEEKGEFEQGEFMKQTESKALEKSTDAKMVRSGGFFFWKPPQIDCDRVRI